MTDAKYVWAWNGGRQLCVAPNKRAARAAFAARLESPVPFSDVTRANGPFALTDGCGNVSRHDEAYFADNVALDEFGCVMEGD